MQDLKNQGPATISPGMRYRNAPAAIEWLCRAFGFEKHLVVPGPDDTIVHAQLTYGNGMIMLSSKLDTEFNQLIKQPEELGGFETQSPYVILLFFAGCGKLYLMPTHYAQAKGAGAKIVLDIVDASYGGRGYSCRDLEGHLWSFGTYNPWVEGKEG
jgi:uncharacterized glyoxalase superfamily protein PhnB